MTHSAGFVDDYLAYLLARASHLISSEFHAVVEASGLSLMEWRVMASLSGKESLSVGELADIVLAKQPTVTKLVGRMAEAGWVRRVNAAHDKRQSLVSLTLAGQRKVKPLLAQARTHEAQVLKEIGNSDVTQLKRVLEHLIEARSLSISHPLK
ncbi:MarR family winged helix-turn-helix transcriptional regulator [Limnohabitans radicicola]|uniref:MarR family transcriptional regulator n=1 Tax=Limnohabitans radicicola TaxID=2771427 RepID=A0A927FHA9_9BURK|nr:MarR family transcriptional regulator [Limnohabitans radicicola]MBD8049600.1 MarR family transcriptional regulator [Limnohabitans radicicola]